MVTRVNTVAFQGIDVSPVDVQVQIANGLPAFSIVGLPDKAISEARDRVRAAFHSLNLSLPAKRITVNLAPADLTKEGSHFDLPIALALLGAMGVLPSDEIAEVCAVGELSLDGRLRPVAGVLPAAMFANQCHHTFICPRESGREAAWAGDVEVLAPDSLLGLINHFKGTQVLSQPEIPINPNNDNLEESILDYADIKGQEMAKRAMEIAAAGGHNLLMVGPPGSGKSMLAARLPTILPPLSPEEALDVSMIHSLAGMLEGGRIVMTRPFRDPHHSASLPSLVGGGHKAKPGEISLAHHGVLFLDELPEFQRATLEALRQPLETGKTLVARVNAHVTYPSEFQLIAAMNPCRCGHLSDASLACSRAPKCAADYQSKISGPLLDRFDIRVEVPAVSITDLSLPRPEEGSAQMRARVLHARQFQQERMKALGLGTDTRTNSKLQGQDLEKSVIVDEESQALLNKAAEMLKLSARGYHRVLRVARTIADLESSDAVKKHHLAEALSYRHFNPIQ